MTIFNHYGTKWSFWPLITKNVTVTVIMVIKSQSYAIFELYRLELFVFSSNQVWDPPISETLSSSSFFNPRTFPRKFGRRSRGMAWTQLEWEQRLYIFVCLLSYCDAIQFLLIISYLKKPHLRSTWSVFHNFNTIRTGIYFSIQCNR